MAGTLCVCLSLRICFSLHISLSNCLCRDMYANSLVIKTGAIFVFINTLLSEEVQSGAGGCAFSLSSAQTWSLLTHHDLSGRQAEKGE